MKNKEIQKALGKLITECDEFYEDELKKEKLDIYKDHYLIHFMESLKDYFDEAYRDFEENGTYSESLRTLFENILPTTMTLLYCDFLSFEHSSVNTWEDIYLFLKAVGDKNKR